MSVTPSEEYQQLLWNIEQNYNTPTTALLLPSSEEIYEINLNDRTIKVPEFLSIQHDHQAETIFFKVDRYYDYIDLVETTGVIVYENANGEQYIYPIPYYDYQTFDGKIIMPWCIQGPATAYAGKVKFAFKFYKLDSNKDLAYELNTQPAVSKVLTGWDSAIQDFEDIQVNLDSTTAERIKTIMDSEAFDVYWINLNNL